MTNSWPPTFSLDQERVLKLFTGDRFYSDSDAALREVILNAIDAICRRQSIGANVHPKISVVFDKDALSVTVEDNGDGMSQDDVANLFSKVGASASNLAKKAGEPQVKTIGEFGIGVVSYFLVCDSFQIHTYKDGAKQLGLQFTTEMLNGKIPATEIPPLRDEIGTLVKFSVRETALFELLQNRFPHWVRDVSHLHATSQPENKALLQGGIKGGIKQLELDTPEWIEDAHIGPPLSFDIWNSFDGEAHVDILYRGIFVEKINFRVLWGIEGTLHVDPKHFKPKLNREGFIGGDLKNEVGTFLQSVHPKVLAAAANCLQEVLSSPGAKDWAIRKYVTLWLAIPRSSNYKEAAMLWDEQFRNRKAFRLLRSGEHDSEVSIADLQALGVDNLYVKPLNIPPNNLVLGPAVRVLLARKLPVIQGIQRDQGFLGSASFIGESTTDLLLGYFGDVLPKLTRVEAIAEEMLQQDSVADLYEDDPRVRLVKLGTDSSSVVVVRQEIWVNIDTSAGRSIVLEVCERNEGYSGLWIACLRYASDQTNPISSLLKGKVENTHRLGLVRRQYIRGILGCS